MDESPYPFTRQMYEDWLRERDPDEPVCDLFDGRDATHHCPIAFFVNHDGMDLKEARVQPLEMRAVLTTDNTVRYWKNPDWVRMFIDAFDMLRLHPEGKDPFGGNIYPLRYHNFTASEVLAVLEAVPREEERNGV